MNNQNIRILFLIERSKINRLGQVPLRCRITYSGERKIFSTGLFINPDKWNALWNDLKEKGVDLSDDNEVAKEQLLNWLDFWSPGNHDDRTIAILY